MKLEDLLSLISDVIGFVSAVLMAIPALHTQRDVLAQMRIDEAKPADRYAEQAREWAAEDVGRRVVRLTSRDVKLFVAGTALLVLSFAVKIASTIVHNLAG